MKIAFTADLHLDSAFAHEDSTSRNGDLLTVFKDILSAAKEEGASTLLLGGDIFDRPHPSQATVSAVKKLISDSKIKTYAVAGNHDPLGTVSLYSDPPENMYVFGKDPGIVDIGGIPLVGASVTDYTDHRNIFSGVRVPQGAVLLCHGSLYEGSGHYVCREAVENTGASLCLMGHIHKTALYDWQGVRALYCGSPAGRGFDELGEHGYYIIDTELKTFTYCKTNVKIYKEYLVDVTDCANSSDIVNKLKDIPVDKNEISRAIITGEIDGSFYIDCKAIASFTDFFEVKDGTVICQDILKNENSDTLEGEFIRILKAMAQDADDDEKQKINDAIKEGITLLRSGR